jgi:hypothetical protein
VDIQNRYREGILWIDLQRDIRAFMIYRKHGKLSSVQWIKSFRYEKEWAIFARYDWKPSLIATLKLFDRPINLIKQKLKLGKH